MFFKRFMAAVLTLAMLCSCFMFVNAENSANETLLIAPNPNASAPVSETQTATEVQPTQEQINKEATGFIDITPDAPYAKAVKKLVDFGIINGYEDGTFKPFGEVTRAEMSKMLNLALGYTDFEGAKGFSDVTDKNWYYTYALAAQKQGYIEGYEDGSFRGSNNITRQEMCAILNRLLKPMNLGIPVTINDEVANWARPHVEIIVQNYIMPLEEGNTFRATQNLKRHELATVLSNMAIGPVKKIEAEIRFFVNGEQYGETQLVEVGKSAVVPENPALPGEGYVFDGWRVIGSTEVTDVASKIVVSSADYEAVFKKQTFEVNFYSRGAVVETQNVSFGEYVKAPKNPEASGYEFNGWALTDGGIPVKLSETKIDKNTDFYAVFEKETTGGGGGGGGPAETRYSVSFFVDGSLYGTKQSIIKNGSPKLPEVPEKDGYTFVGWSYEPDGETVNVKAIKVTSSVTLYAVFEEIEVEIPVYTVNFYSDGKVVATQYVEEDGSPKSVSKPKKDGYVFKHWSKTEGGSAVELAYVVVTGNMDFYAVFEKVVEEKKYYDVIFMVDGEEVSRTSVEEGKKTTAPATPIKDGYTFKHWSNKENGNSVTVSSVAINEETVFYAVFEKNKPKEYEVVFYADGKVHAKQSVIENETPEVPANPAKEGYTFKGWAESENGDVVNVGSFVITHSTDFFAVFEEKKPEIITYTIKFVVDGKTYDSQEVEKGSKITVPKDPAKENHKFLGWSKTNGGSVTSVETTANANATYYAVFEEIIKHKVIFYVNGIEYREFTVIDGETVSAPSVNVEGYNFLGWAKTEDGEKVDVGSVKIISDTEFYALLEEKEPDKVFYTVKFMANGKAHDTQNVESGKFASIPSSEPEKDGYTFLGWSTSSTGAVIDVSKIAITKATFFHAVFEKNPEIYTVTFMVDGKEYDSCEVESGEYPDTPDDPEKDGYIFLGWSKTNGGTTTVYPDKIAVSDNTTYYAVFEEEEEEEPEIVYHTVSFWFDGEKILEYEVEHGDLVNEPKTPKVEDGYCFMGWSLFDDNDAESVIDVTVIEIKKDFKFYSVIIENPNDDDLMDNLRVANTRLGMLRCDPEHPIHGTTRDQIKSVVGKVLADAEAGIYVDKAYVLDEYESDVNKVKKFINKDMTPSEKSDFVNMLTNEKNFPKKVQDFLVDYFDVDTNI